METGGWLKLTSAGDVACGFSPESGRKVQGPQGQDLELSATLFVHPSALPTGVTVAANDLVVLTVGRAARTVYEVVHADPVGELSQRWDDEVLLIDSDEDPTNV